MKKFLIFISITATIVFAGSGCSGSKDVTEEKVTENRDLALDHYINGSLLDQKGDYAKAILEYQDALVYSKDPAIYNSIAKDYAMLGKNELATSMGREAVRLNPENMAYRRTLAEIYINALEFDSAIVAFEGIVEHDPTDHEAWSTLAHIQQMRDPVKAQKMYEQIIDRFGTDGDAYFQLAQIYAASNRIGDAIKALGGLLSIDPENNEIKKALADMYIRSDSVDTALRMYQDLVELDSENLEVRGAIARAYLLKHDYDKAAEQFEIVMSKDSATADEQIRFGQVFVSFIERDSAVAPVAITMFERIRDKHLDDWRPYGMLGAIHNIMRNDSLAVVNFTKVIDLAKWNPDGWLGVASFYYDHGKFNEAIDLLHEAEKFVTDEYRIHFILGISYQRIQKPVEAATALEKALQLNKKSLDAASALGLVYNELQRYEESDTMYERALQINAQDDLVLNNYSYSLAQRGIMLDRALAMSKQALARQPENQSYLDTYGWIHYKRGDFKEAERWIRKAIELGSTSAVVHDHLGDVYYKLSEKEKAIDFWKRASEFDSENESYKEKVRRGSL
jgi:tetratricopeptide (TPR) repeat protein